MSERPDIQSVLFDLDNTLYDRAAAIVDYSRGLHRAKNVINQSNSEQETVKLIVSFDEDGLKPRDEFISDMLKQWPGLFSDVESGMAEYISAYARSIYLDSDTKKLLSDIRERGLSCGIVTNGRTDMQMRKIRMTGLDSLVQSVVVSESVDVWKPDRRIFEHALREIDADPLKTLFAGDNPEADVLGAKSLGMTTAWVHRGREWPYDGTSPDYVVDRVSEVGKILFG